MEIINVNEPFPYIKVKNFFDENELKIIWEELDFLCYPEKLQPPEKTGTATCNNKPLKNNLGLHLNNKFYNNLSPIIKSNYKVLTIIRKNFSQHPSWFFRTYEDKPLKIDNLVSYYEDKSFYKKHYDCKLFTLLIWMYKHPKSFAGGNFCFDNYDIEIKPENNCGILFPSGVHHSVKEVEMQSKDLGKKLGRFCLTYFIDGAFFDTIEISNKKMINYTEENNLTVNRINYQ